MRVIYDVHNQILFPEFYSIINFSKHAKMAVFERRAQKAIYANMSKGMVYDLHPLLASNRNGHIRTMSGRVTRRILFQAISDLSSLGNGDFAKAIIHDFPEIDVVLKLAGICYLLQMTIPSQFGC